MSAGTLKLSGLHPEVKDRARWALGWADYYGVPVSVTSGYRSWEEQQRLYSTYQQGRSRWPANPPGQSSHNFGFAFDSTVDPRYQSWWTMVRELAGFEVLPNDIIHGQVPNWRNYA